MIACQGRSCIQRPGTPHLPLRLLPGTTRPLACVVDGATCIAAPHCQQSCVHVHAHPHATSMALPTLPVLLRTAWMQPDLDHEHRYPLDEQYMLPKHRCCYAPGMLQIRGSLLALAAGGQPYRRLLQSSPLATIGAQCAALHTSTCPCTVQIKGVGPKGEMLSMPLLTFSATSSADTRGAEGTSITGCLASSAAVGAPSTPND
jgi:hypothetical protein